MHASAPQPPPKPLPLVPGPLSSHRDYPPWHRQQENPRRGPLGPPRSSLESDPSQEAWTLLQRWCPLRLHGPLDSSPMSTCPHIPMGEAHTPAEKPNAGGVSGLLVPLSHQPLGATLLVSGWLRIGEEQAPPTPGTSASHHPSQDSHLNLDDLHLKPSGRTFQTHPAPVCQVASCSTGVGGVALIPGPHPCSPPPPAHPLAPGMAPGPTPTLPPTQASVVPPGHLSLTPTSLCSYPPPRPPAFSPSTHHSQICSLPLPPKASSMRAGIWASLAVSSGPQEHPGHGD